MACLIASSTATVRDGSAPAAPARDANPGPSAALGLAALGAEALGVGIMYCISYTTWVEGKPGEGAVSTAG